MAEDKNAVEEKVCQHSTFEAITSKQSQCWLSLPGEKHTVNCSDEINIDKKKNRRNSVCSECWILPKHNFLPSTEMWKVLT